MSQNTYFYPAAEFSQKEGDSYAITGQLVENKGTVNAASGLGNTAKTTTTTTDAITLKPSNPNTGTSAILPPPTNTTVSASPVSSDVPSPAPPSYSETIIPATTTTTQISQTAESTLPKGSDPSIDSRPAAAAGLPVSTTTTTTPLMSSVPLQTDTTAVGTSSPAAAITTSTIGSVGNPITVVDTLSNKVETASVPAINSIPTSSNINI